MTQIISRNVIDNKKEKKILMGIITSDKICRELLPILRNRRFNLPYFTTIVKWVDDYFSIYEKAPNSLIEDLFESSKKTLNDEEIRLIDVFLETLSQEYQYEPETNEDYLIQTSMEYIDEISIVQLSNKLQELAKLGKIQDAKNALTNFKGVMRQTSGWANPFDSFEINNAMEYEDDILFRFNGQLGELIGDFLRGHFIAILAPIKRNKTWFLIELAILALTYNLKVVFVSLEMDKKRMLRRIYKRIISASESGFSYVKYPCFDCEDNQSGFCSMKERTNKHKLINSMGGIPEFSPDHPYKPCTYCRDNKLTTYKPTTWYTSEVRPVFETDLIRNKLRSFSKTFGKNNFRFKSYPRFSIGTEQFERDLNILRETENFNPDVIITDYIDIFQKSKGEFRHTVDELWMTHARWASEYKCLVATVTQSNKESWEKKTVKASDTSENYRNPAHVDKYISLSQTPEEKQKGISRITLIASRDGNFDENKSVSVLQCIDAGQPLIDSEFI